MHCIRSKHVLEYPRGVPSAQRSMPGVTLLIKKVQQHVNGRFVALCVFAAAIEPEFIGLQLHHRAHDLNLDRFEGSFEKLLEHARFGSEVANAITRIEEVVS